MVQNELKKVEWAKIFKNGVPLREALNPKGIITARGKTPPKEDKS